MGKELEQLARLTPANVVDAFKAIRVRRNLLVLENPADLLYELTAKGMGDVAEYLTNGTDEFDWQRYDLAIVAVLVDQRKNVIR